MFGATKNYFYLCQRLDEVWSIKGNDMSNRGLTPLQHRIIIAALLSTHQQGGLFLFPLKTKC